LADVDTGCVATHVGCTIGMLACTKESVYSIVCGRVLAAESFSPVKTRYTVNENDITGGSRTLSLAGHCGHVHAASWWGEGGGEGDCCTDDSALLKRFFIFCCFEPTLEREFLSLTPLSLLALWYSRLSCCSCCKQQRGLPAVWELGGTANGL